MNAEFAERLRRRERLIGSLVSLDSPEVAEMLAKTGLDWLFFDGEHAPLTILAWQRLVQAVAGRAACVLRVPSASERDIKKALDIGVDGIIVPMVNDAALARAVVEWSKYPPEGRRGIGLARAHGYGLDFADYLENANRRTAVIVQAEHRDAIDNIDAIAAVDGIDAIFIGPYDLSASVGKPGDIDSPEMRAAIARVVEAGQKHGRALGYFGVDAASVAPAIDAGFTLVCAGVDAGFVTAGAGAVLDRLRP